jgi:hypothetical protein
MKMPQLTSITQIFELFGEEDMISCATKSLMLSCRRRRFFGTPELFQQQSSPQTSSDTSNQSISRAHQAIIGMTSFFIFLNLCSPSLTSGLSSFSKIFQVKGVFSRLSFFVQV